MSVATSLASMLEKLKVEEPWLPPRTWEAIPSESGRCPVPSRASASPSSSSSVSESSLVRLSLNALQGVESALISIEKLASAFCSRPSDRTSHTIPSLWHRSSSTDSLGQILRTIGRFGSSVFLLHKFVSHFTNLESDVEAKQGVHKASCSSYTLVNQAFAIAVRKVLEGYISGLDTLCASVELRRSSNIVDDASCYNSSSRLGCLTSVVQSKITLLETFLHTRELRTQIEALANICDVYDVASSFCESPWEDLTAEAALRFHKFFRGADLLTYLYSQLKVADPAHSAMLKFLFLKTCEPYCGLIRSWIFEAQVSDPHKEFIVELIDEAQPFSWSKPVIFPMQSVREREGGNVPCFLKGLLVPLVRAGQQLQVIAKLLELCNFSLSGDDSYTDLLPHWTHYSSTSLPHASPITFGKVHIEAMVKARNDYYRRMLNELSKKLELCSEQVAGARSLPIYYCDGGENPNRLDLISPDEPLLIPSTMVQHGSDFDDQTEDPCGLETDATWSSDCSSSVDSEEATETELITTHSTVIDSEQNYLSALHFFVASADNSGQKLVQLENSSHIDDYLTSNVVKTESHGLWVDPTSEESTAGSMDIKYKCPPSINSWPLGGLPRNPFYSDKERSDFNNTPLSGKSSKEKKGPGFPGNSSSSKSSLLHDRKLNYPSKVLSLNGGHRGKLLPWFDFSLVDDPSKACLEKLSISIPVGFLEESRVALTSSKNHNRDNQEHDTDKTKIEDPKASYNRIPSSGSRDGSEEDTANAFGGSRWESMLGKSNNRESNTISGSTDNSFDTFELPLDFVIEKCLLQEIHLQYNFVSKLAIKLLEGFGLREHLLALRRYHFMELADWADSFIISLWNHKWLITEADKRSAEIQGFLELSIQKSSCERDPCKDRLFIYMKSQGTVLLPSAVVGVRSFDFLGLGYRVDWPISIVLTLDALKAYADVFSFLIQVKLAAYALTHVWCSLKDVRHMLHRNQQEITSQELHWLNISMKLRHQISHFVSTLQQYVQSELSHVSWSKFLHSLDHKVKDMMDLESVHMTYLNEALRICFLSEESCAISNIIENILQCALEFQTCLPRGIAHTIHEERTTTLGINTSQVINVKRNHDKYMKELHLCYMRSPKLRSSGLSRFWGYLNFNQYYSEVFNESNTFGFIG